MPTQLEYQRIIPRPMPKHVAAVAWVFISFGILAALEIIWSAINLRLSINLGVLGIFIGRGLLKTTGCLAEVCRRDAGAHRMHGYGDSAPVTVYFIE